jgi:hypothetical protein
VAAQVRGDDVEPVCEALLGEPAEAAPVSLDAVQADDERCLGVAPLVGMELQELPSGS